MKFEDKIILGLLHAGIGLTHVEGFLSIIGLRCFSVGTYKTIERKVGPAIEKVACDSCTKWKKEKERIEFENKQAPNH